MAAEGFQRAARAAPKIANAADRVHRAVDPDHEAGQVRLPKLVGRSAIAKVNKIFELAKALENTVDPDGPEEASDIDVLTRAAAFAAAQAVRALEVTRGGPGHDSPEEVAARAQQIRDMELVMEYPYLTAMYRAGAVVDPARDRNAPSEVQERAFLERYGPTIEQTIERGNVAPDAIQAELVRQRNIENERGRVPEAGRGTPGREVERSRARSRREGPGIETPGRDRGLGR